MNRRVLCLLALLVCLLSACEQRMNRQPKYLALAPSERFPDNQAARHPPPGTVARDQSAVPLQAPARLSREDLQRGRERFDIYCAPCHGITGHGNGLVVQRGFPAPPSYHTPRLRAVDLAYIVDVISNGYGIMYSYTDRVAPADRWRIAAYVRALQHSQYTDLNRWPRFRDAVMQATEQTAGDDAQTPEGDGND